MILNEFIVEDAALIMPAATLTPALSHGEKVKREAIRRLNPAHQSRTLVALRDTLMPKLLGGELSVAALESRMETLP